MPKAETVPSVSNESSPNQLVSTIHKHQLIQLALSDKSIIIVGTGMLVSRIVSIGK